MGTAPRRAQALLSEALSDMQKQAKKVDALDEVTPSHPPKHTTVEAGC